jgi:hypothetical protein
LPQYAFSPVGGVLAVANPTDKNKKIKRGAKARMPGDETGRGNCK